VLEKIKGIIYSKTESGIFWRSVIEAVLAYFIANIGDIFNLFTISPEAKTFIMGLAMVLLTRLLQYLREIDSKTTQIN